METLDTSHLSAQIKRYTIQKSISDVVEQLGQFPRKFPHKNVIKMDHVLIAITSEQLRLSTLHTTPFLYVKMYFNALH